MKNSVVHKSDTPPVNNINFFTIRGKDIQITYKNQQEVLSARQKPVVFALFQDSIHMVIS